VCEFAGFVSGGAFIPQSTIETPLILANPNTEASLYLNPPALKMGV
jgi:hypothetical protein